MFSSYRHFVRFAAAAAASAALLVSQSNLPTDVEKVLNSITSAELKADLSFLASDALAGRYTPSPGLEVAAEFIASRFREASLQTGGDHDYFQTAAMVERRLPEAKSSLLVEDGSQTFSVPSSDIGISAVNEAAQIDHVPVLVVRSRDPELLKHVDLRGKAILAPQVDYQKIAKDQIMSVYRQSRTFNQAIASSGAAVEILVGDQGRGREDAQLISAEEAHAQSVPTLMVKSSMLKSWIDHADNTEKRNISFMVPAPQDEKVTVKNVVAILRGSDPVLNKTCVVLSAHYDHIGTTETAGRMAMNSRSAGNDHIYNGANDDGSGTVSVIEIARALAKMNPRPKRSVVFVTFFGEERGELGSQYYAKHPVFPFSKTVADVNLEQMGRTDSTTGKQLNSASLTGFDYSDVTKFLEEAGRKTGIKFYFDKEASDDYFMRSDNDALAQRGVPAHSLTVAFDFPDYHGLGDEWQKIDYDNMARVDRMIALGVLDMANSAKAPEWNAENPKTAAFREAQQKSRKP